MPSASAIYSSGRWLNASDIVDKVGLGKRITAMITHVEPAMIGMGQDQKEQLVLDLASRQGQPWPKKLTLNQTRNMALVAAFGDDYSQWHSKIIEVWAEKVPFAGKLVDGIKIGPSNGNGTAQGTAQATQAAPASPPPSATAVAGTPPVSYPNWNIPSRNQGTPIEDDEIPF